jgi:electron transfer flavoprotein beta subunit
MNIFVCVKQVPDTETKIKLSADANSIDTAGFKWVINPYDEYAIEEALKFKQAKPEAVVNVISVGPKARASEALRTALAMGADEAIVIDAPESVDNLTVASALAAAIKDSSPALIFSGKSAIDDNSLAVSQMLAELLKLPHATSVTKFENKGDSVVVEREIDGGAKEVVELKLPAVVAANKGLNTPRYASLPGIMKAKKKVIKELSLDGLGVSATQSKVKFAAYQLPPDRPACKILSGDPGAQTSALVGLLRNESKVI